MLKSRVVFRMKTLLTIIHFIISLFLIVLILLQSEGSGLSSAWGGATTPYHSRRGMEKIVFTLTIVFSVAFFITSLINFLVF
jgi:preprotein translocase subunit SecG